MELKNAIEQLKDLKEDRKSFVQNDELADEIFLKDIEAIDTILDSFFLHFAEDVQAENDKLKKENEELKKRFRRYGDVDLVTLTQIKEIEETVPKMYIDKETYENLLKENEKYRKVIDNAQKDSISKDKIKELIIKKKQQIQENNKQIEECRKTIMEEQELKKLQLFTLNKNNDLLELEIVDLFELLKGE